MRFEMSTPPFDKPWHLATVQIDKVQLEGVVHFCALIRDGGTAVGLTNIDHKECSQYTKQLLLRGRVSK